MSWEWIKGRGGYRVLMDGEKTILSSDDEIAEYTTDHVISWIDVSDEDARLIAAAPELLEALQWAVGQIDLWAEDFCEPNDAASIRLSHARAAIAKATQP